MLTILLIIVIIVLLGGATGSGGPVVVPGNPVPFGYGYGFGGLIGLLLFVLVVWLLLSLVGGGVHGLAW